MSNTTTTALAIPATIQPKPTKAEIIESMVIRAKERQAIINEECSKKIDTLEPKIRKAAIKAIKNQSPTIVVTPRINIYSRCQEPYCNVNYPKVTSPELDKLMAEHAEYVKKIKHIDEKELRKEIKSKLSSASNPNPLQLLENPDSLKAINITLDTIGIS
jgi:hypothetical protein